MINIKEAVEKFEKKEITIEELKKIVDENGGDLKFWDAHKERNPRYKEGDNQSRTGFIWSPYHHVKGKMFQWVIKEAIRKFITFAHDTMLKHYDKEAFIYDDPRLNALNDFFKSYIDVNFHDSFPYKHDMLDNVVDILLGLAKEDIYYRARFLDLLNQLIKVYSYGFEITKDERENIERFH